MCMLATGVVPDGASTLHEPQQRLERTWKQTSLREPAVAMRWSNGCTAIGTPANTPAPPTAAASFASTQPSVGVAPGTCSHKPTTPFRHAVATWALRGGGYASVPLVAWCDCVVIHGHLEFGAVVIFLVSRDSTGHSLSRCFLVQPCGLQVGKRVLEQALRVHKGATTANRHSCEHLRLVLEPPQTSRTRSTP